MTSVAQIRLQFVCEASLSSWTIAWFSAGHFSHVDCLLDDGMLLGARADRVGGKSAGVQIRPPDYAKFAQRVVMEVPCTAEQKGIFLDFLHDQIDKPYDHEAIWAFLFNRDWRKADSWICSELQSRAGEVAGILPQLYLAANKIVPVSCALVYSAVGGHPKQE